jgi:hypothetical protein
MKIGFSLNKKFPEQVESKPTKLYYPKLKFEINFISF